MNEIGAFEAKNTLGALLDRVERGEEIVITRHGKAVARLVPNTRRVDPKQALAAFERIRERARQLQKKGPRPSTGLHSRNAEIKIGPEESARIFMSFVLDTSTALAWAYSDETTQAVTQVFDLLAQSGAWVPGLWHLEIASVLEVGVRRKRHNAQFRDATLADLAQLPI